VSLPGVVATLAALEPAGQEWLAALVAQLRDRRDQLVSGLRATAPGVRVVVPEAGYLLWADFSDTPLARAPAEHLREVGLRVSPGAEFGPNSATHVRLNFATSREGIDRIIDCVAKAVAKTGG
jgi:cystathionine beta-lyase